MSDKTCNGWSNWATWNCNLWIDDFTDQAIECIKDNWDKEDPDNIASATSILADMIEQTVTEFMPKIEGFYADMLNSAMHDINYREIAEHYISDNVKEVTDELKADNAEE